MIKNVGQHLKQDTDDYKIIGNSSDTLSQKCFSVMVEYQECFSSRVDNSCYDFENEDIPRTPNNIRKDLPYRVWAIDYHSKLNRLFLVIEEVVDNLNDEIIDEFAKINLTLNNDKYGYLPPYLFREIVSVKKYVAGEEEDVNYEIKQDNSGNDYLEFNEYIDGLFKVTYKATILTKIAEFDFILLQNGDIKLYPTGLEKEISKDLIGSGCLLMSHQDSETNDPLLFRDKNKNSWRVDLFDLSIKRLNFDTPSYMASPKYAYNSSATGAYNIDTNIGKKTYFLNKIRIDKITRAELKYFFQDNINDDTFAFIKFIDTPIPKQQDRLVIMPYLNWEAYRTVLEFAEWSGAGSTGNVSSSGYYTKTDFISIKPDRPQIKNKHFINGEYYNFYNMREYYDLHFVLDGVKLPTNIQLHEDQKRISINNLHFFCARNNIYCIKQYRNTILSIKNIDGIDFGVFGKVYDLGAITNTADYTITDNGLLLIVDGKKKIDVRIVDYL